jgi:hypothetical protein
MQSGDNKSQGDEGGGSTRLSMVGAMKLITCIATGALATGVLVVPVRADERRFTYTYEPETPVAGSLEFENWVTLGTQRNSTVGQNNYNQWDLRQELEYGVSDRYSVSLYLNEQATSFQDAGTGANESSFDWKGVSLENRYNVLNPAEHAVGLTLYLEGTYSGQEAEIEEKLILGQRHGEWKWAFNLIQGTEWEDNLRETEGELGASVGLARDLNKQWSVGLELLNETLIPDYKAFESSTLFLGPVVSCRQHKWWAALTVMPQIYGWNSDGAADGNSHLDLVDHEKANVRLLFGVDF